MVLENKYLHKLKQANKIYRNKNNDKQPEYISKSNNSENKSSRNSSIQNNYTNQLI